MIFKYRNDNFKTSDVDELKKHLAELGHKDYALLEGDTVIVDWVHIERLEPSRV